MTGSAGPPPDADPADRPNGTLDPADRAEAVDGDRTRPCAYAGRRRDQTTAVAQDLRWRRLLN